MAGFDTTNVAADVQPVSALDQLGSLANTVNAINQNKMFQAKARAGQYVSQSMGPDGMPDANTGAKLNAFLQHDRGAGPAIADILQSTASLRQTGIQNQQAGTNLAQSQLVNYQRDLATAGNSSTSINPKQKDIENKRAVASIVADGLASGRYSKDIATANISNGDAFHDAVNAATISGAGGESAYGTEFGKPGTVDTPGAIQQTRYFPTTGQTQTQTGNAAFTEKGINPGEIFQVKNPDGSATPHPASEYFNNDGSVKPGVTLPNIQIANASAASQQAYGVGIGQQAQDFENDVGASNQRRQNLENLRSVSDKIIGGQEGPIIKVIGEALAPLGINVPGTASQEQIEKYTSEALSQQAHRLNLNGTDTARLTAAATTPGWTLTKTGRDRVLGNLLAVEDWKIAAGQVWAKQKSNPKGGIQTFGDLQTQLPRKLPLGVFQESYLPANERFKDVPENQRPELQRKYNIIKKLGFLPNDPEE